mmetsp:Transcript_23904/g.51135  ORF Transcript_23904/g.51135 Transcript_23904/m.51135 type:complete len:202 (+) Transcript_23904:288-893(+)
MCSLVIYQHGDWIHLPTISTFCGRGLHWICGRHTGWDVRAVRPPLGRIGGVAPCPSWLVVGIAAVVVPTLQTLSREFRRRTRVPVGELPTPRLAGVGASCGVGGSGDGAAVVGLTDDVAATEWGVCTFTFRLTSSIGKRRAPSWRLRHIETGVLRLQVAACGGAITMTIHLHSVAFYLSFRAGGVAATKGGGLRSDKFAAR